MNAVEQAELAARFQHALTLMRLRFERSQSVNGQLVYQEVPAEAILGRLLQFGWRVTLCETPGRPVQIGGDDPRQLRLVTFDGTVNDGEDDGA